MDAAPTRPPNPPYRRAVVLGASNVTRGLPGLLRSIGERDPGPVDLLVAAGHGRSYGVGSRVLGRELPAILASGLWDALADRPPLSTTALVTDVGNDILYGAPPEQIVAWVEEALCRLLDVARPIVLTGLPLEGLAELGTGRYRVVRTLLFPGCRLPLTEAVARAHTVHAGLREVAAQRGAVFAAPDPAWYGLDPIHIRRAWRQEAWRALLDPWPGPPSDAEQRRVRDPGIGVRLLRPAHRRVLGFVQRKAQPAAVLPDGTRVSLY